MESKRPRHMIVDVDDLVPSADTETLPEVGTKAGRGSPKLRRAAEMARKTEQELSTLCQGLNDRIAELGLDVQRANEYRGMERVLHVLGSAGLRWAQNRAAMSRRERLKALKTEDAVNEIGQIVTATIGELGNAETEYETDQREYEEKLSEVLAKLEEATPMYEDALALRARLDEEASMLGKVLAGAQLSQRPQHEQQFEATKRRLDAAKLDEATYLAVVKNAQEAIPELQKNRDAATKAIQSLHGMRQSMLEKFADFRIVLERATTAMRARASIELFEDADPAFNAALTSITANNVATAGAALEVWTERIRQAAIDPLRSQELLQELLQHITDAAVSLSGTEATVSQGSPLTDRSLVPMDLTPMRVLEPVTVPTPHKSLDLYPHRPQPKG